MSRAESASERRLDAGSSAAGDPAAITSARGELQRQVDDLAGSQTALAARVHRLDREGPAVPMALRRALADFSRELDALRAELDELAEAAGAPILGLTR